MQNSLDEFEKDDSGNRASPTESANRKMRPKDNCGMFISRLHLMQISINRNAQ